MSMRPIIVSLFATAAIVVACGTPDIEGSPLEAPSATEPIDSGSVTKPIDPAWCEGPEKLDKMDPSTLPPCCDGTAHCVPKAKVPGIVRKALSECDGGYCVPDAFLLSGGAPAPSCTAFNDTPGACISKCVPEVGKNASLLKEDTCKGGELCTPCVHPLTKEKTGVCEIGRQEPLPAGACNDAGAGSAGGGDGGKGSAPCPHVGAPVLDPTKLPACGDVAGAHCLDASLVPAAMAAKLAKCATGLCVPDDFIASGGNFIPPTCTSIGGIEGRCLHKALPDVASQASILGQGTCKPSELCAPCWHPASGADTGACKLSCDPGPKQGPPACPHAGPDVFTPSKFPQCATAAHCMPTNLLDAASLAELAACSGGRCVPDVFIKSAGRYIPKTCSSVGGGEGRCLHTAIPKIGAQASKLPISTCAPYERCAPCYDPIDGKDTGACTRSCDPGPTKPKYTFPFCCALAGSYRGRCVPHTSIPDAQETNLSKDVCTAPADLCVPSENLADAFQPKPCTAFALAYFGNYQGVCLSSCLKFTGFSDIIIKQGSCDAVHQCVPCYKPFGAPTGAPGCN
jgi:hypothetical protein